MGTCGLAPKGPFHRTSWAEAACQSCARRGGCKHRLYLVHHSAHHDVPKADLQAGIHGEEGSVQLQGVGHPQNLCSNTSGALKIEDLIHAKEPMGGHFQLKQRKAHKGFSHSARPLRGRWLPSPQGNKWTLLDTSALNSWGWYYWHLGRMLLHRAKLPVHCRNSASLSSVL